MGWGAALGSAFGSIMNFGLGMSQQQQQNVFNAQQLAFAREQMAKQEEFAKFGLRWKTEDAKAAGIHPLFAMGAPASSFTPVSSGMSMPSGMNMGDLGGSMASMGQNLERAINSSRTNEERMIQAHEARHQMGLQTERMELENTYLRTQIMRNLRPNPPFPSVGVSGGGLSGQQPGVVASPSLGQYEMKPFEVTTGNPNSGGQAAGPVQPTVSWGLTADGSGMQAYPSKIPGLDEVEGPLGWEWYIRNRIIPAISPGLGPDMAVVAKHWPGAIGVRFDHESLTWKPVYPNRPRYAVPPKATARDVGVGIRHPMLTSRWRDYKN